MVVTSLPPGEEATKGCEPPVESLDVVQCLGSCHVNDRLNFVWVHFNPPTGDHEPEELPGVYSKHALRWVQLHLVAPKDLKSFAQVSDVILHLLRFYQKVVHVRLDIAANLLLE